MNDDEVVLTLLDYYKKKGIDLYKVLDDPLFKTLSRDTQIKAIQMYAQRISDGTPSFVNSNDFKSALKQMLFRSGIGAVTGGIAGLGFARAFHNGKVPAEAFAAGALIGAAGGVIHSIGNTAANLADRHHMRRELNEVAASPTPRNALNVMLANHLRNPSTQDFKNSTQEVLNESTENLKDNRKTLLKGFVEQYNRDQGNTPL